MANEADEGAEDDLDAMHPVVLISLFPQPSSDRNRNLWKARTAPRIHERRRRNLFARFVLTPCVPPTAESGRKRRPK